jgi:spermidine/putrescine-binding protein
VAEGEFVCPEPNPRMEVTSKTLNVFTFIEYVPDDFMRCFEEVYGVDVNSGGFSTNSEMYAKLNAGASGYDLVQGSDYIVAPLVRQGLIQPLDHERLPALANINPDYLNLAFDPGNEFTLPYQAGTYAIAVNTDAVENVPSSWADLWSPEYAGRLTFLDDARSVIGLTLLTLGYDINSTDPAQLAEAKARLMELVPNIKLFESDNPKAPLLAGDVDLGMVWTGEAFLAHIENPAIEYIYPSEGAVLWQDNWAIPADAANVDAAYAFLNYLNQPDLFWLTLRDFPYTNPNAAALAWAQEHRPELYEAYMASNATNMPAEDIARGHFLQDIGEALPLYDAIWVEVKGQ